MSRIVSALVAVLATVASALLSTPGTAAAAGADITCTPPSSASLLFDPPATNYPQDMTLTVSRQYGPCVSATRPDITSGHSTATGTASGKTCLSLLGANALTIPITWNTGETSVLSGNNVSSLAGAGLTVVTTGTVTSGVFAGATFVHTIVYPSTNVLLCNVGLGTLSGLYGQVVLEIITP
ncbi:hypothetical protein FHX81_1042 [Saccharothrix saharensis]|uniref:Ig-like domain-containing protein n=1 Tax=Saccharothrix saharensis TaxID=571190 RepID=A0A543J7F7_9PSEU|nr:hypothetical protein [Saccharothrix saharensis]TQM78764.1 hypothetical protein FHX81_1042 [Saccharothrix saharensis]